MATVRIIVTAVTSGARAAIAAIGAGLSRMATSARAMAARIGAAIGPLWTRMRTGAMSAFSAIGSFFRTLPAFARTAASGVLGAFRRLGASISSIAASIRSSFSSIGGAGGAGGGGAGGAGGVAAGAGSMVSMLGVLPQMALYATAVVNLTGLIGNLIPLLQLVAPAAIAGAAGLAVFKMATSGVSEALKAGMDGDVEALNKALANLSPSAKSAVLTLLDLRREWKRTQSAVQEKFWAGARADFIRLSRAIQPVADRWLPKIATAFANVRTMVTNVLTTAADTGQLDKIMEGVHRFFTGLLNVVPFLVRALLDVAEVAAPSLGEVGEGIGNMAKRFSDWIRTLKEDGTLKRWLDNAKETFGQVVDVFKEVGRIIAAIFQGGQENTDDFLTNLQQSLSDLAGWLESDDGQATLRFIADIGSALAGLITWIAAVVGWFRSAWDWVAERTEGLRNSLSSAFGAIQNAFAGAMAIISGGAAAFGWIGGVIGKLDSLAAAIGRVAGARARLGGLGAAVMGGMGGVLKQNASGGHPRGLSWVGEHGRELVDFGANGRVYNNGQSERMAASGGGGDVSITVEAAPGPQNWLGQMVTEALRRGAVKMKINTAGRVVLG